MRKNNIHIYIYCIEAVTALLLLLHVSSILARSRLLCVLGLQESRHLEACGVSSVYIYIVKS